MPEASQVLPIMRAKAGGFFPAPETRASGGPVPSVPSPGAPIARIAHPPAPYGIAAFTDALVSEGMSERTIGVYASQLRRAEAAFAQSGFTLDDVTASVVRIYGESLSRTRSTRSLLRSSLRASWRVSERPGSPWGAVRVPTKPRMVCRALEPEDASRLAAAATARRDSKGLAALLALYAGLRRAEIAELLWSDIGDDGWLTVVGKGMVSARIPLHAVVLNAMAHLRPAQPSSTRRRGRLDYVFPGRHGGGAHPATVWGWVRDVAREAGLGDVTTHVLRHTCLTTALDSTRDLRAVQEFARHARPETTAGYTRVHRDRLAETVNAIDYGTRP